MARSCQNKEWEEEKMKRKEGRDGPKWSASAKIRGRNGKNGEKKAETNLNGRPVPK